jgi:methylated-DNA-[protein]-cysteine S-methyltransferase
MESFSVVSTCAGPFGYVARDGALAATYLPATESAIRRRIRADFPLAIEAPHALPEFEHQIDEYFGGRPVTFDVPLDLDGFGPFARRVLELCHDIPYGETRSYGWLARAAGRPAASRAVGGAMASNRIPIVVPCHRVLRSDGSLGGFSSPRGVADKRHLLDMEASGLAALGASEGRMELCAAG